MSSSNSPAERETLRPRERDSLPLLRVEMRDDHFLRTPQQHRRVVKSTSSSSTDHSKKPPQKISKRSLNSVFTPPSEEVSPKDWIEISSSSDFSSDNQLRESAESVTASISPSVSPLQETVASNSTPLSSAVTADQAEGADVSNSVKRDHVEAEMVVNHYKQSQTQSFMESLSSSVSPLPETVASDFTVFSSTVTAAQVGGPVESDSVRTSALPLPEKVAANQVPNSVKTGPTEAEMVVNHLKHAQTQVLNSTYVDLQSKKLLDALIKVVIEEFYNCPEEKDWVTDLASRKGWVMLLFSVLWIFSVSVAFFFRSGERASFNGPPPT